MTIRKLKIPKSEAIAKIVEQRRRGRELLLSVRKDTRDEIKVKYELWRDFTVDILNEIYASDTYGSDFQKHESSEVEYVSADWIPDIRYYVTKQIFPKLQFLKILAEKIDEFLERPDDSEDKAMEGLQERTIRDIPSPSIITIPQLFKFLTAPQVYRLITSIVVVIIGAFSLGMFIQSLRLDMEKYNLFQENQEMKDEIEVIRQEYELLGNKYESVVDSLELLNPPSAP